MERFLFHKALPAFLFALSALFFTACSSSSGGSGGSDNSPTTTDGKVVVPDNFLTDYPNGYILVCSDENNDNSCNEGEPSTTANAATGVFEYMYANYPFVAEFYPSSSAVENTVPILVYTTPAGKDAISALTTMAKNNVDLQAGSTADSAMADLVIAIDESIDLYDAGSYNPESYSSVATINNKASEIAENILAYIKENIEGADAVIKREHIAAVYNIVFSLVEDIASQLESFDVDAESAAATSGSNVEDAIESVESSFDSNQQWNGQKIDLYIIDYSSSSKIYSIVPAEAEGNTFRTWEGEQIPFASLPSKAGAPVITNIVEPNFTRFQLTASTLPAITTPARFCSQTFNLPEGSQVYNISLDSAVFFNRRPASLPWLRDNYDSIERHDHYYLTSLKVGDSFSDNRLSITRNSHNVHTIILEGEDSFTWISAKDQYDPFGAYLSFVKTGKYQKSGSGGSETYEFSAEDGSKAYLFHRNNDSSTWYAGLYPKLTETSIAFNGTAALEIAKEYNTSCRP
ncbi:MAG: hypothetical protein LBP51_02385 [Deferribacteraceae bacterium]|nr:hypothetical protein [Deferribacteraceae bacterium]